MQNLFSYDSSSQPFTEILTVFLFYFLLLLILHCNDFIFRFNSLHCLKTIKFFIHSDFQRRISRCHFAEIIVFYEEEKAVIKNDFLERGWNGFKICKEHPTKSWNRVSVYRLWKDFFRKIILLIEELVQADNEQLLPKKMKI